jgi:hypothetical protein
VSVVKWPRRKAETFEVRMRAYRSRMLTYWMVDLPIVWLGSAALSFGACWELGGSRWIAAVVWIVVALSITVRGRPEMPKPGVDSELGSQEQAGNRT